MYVRIWNEMVAVYLMIVSRYMLEDNYENLQSGWLVSGYRFELDTSGTQNLETSGNIIPLDTQIPERLTKSTFHALDLLRFCTKPLNSQK
jgi:hypothetical protein